MKIPAQLDKAFGNVLVKKCNNGNNEINILIIKITYLVFFYILQQNLIYSFSNSPLSYLYDDNVGSTNVSPNGHIVPVIVFVFFVPYYVFSSAV
jgi:hypothetical protein